MDKGRIGQRKLGDSGEGSPRAVEGLSLEYNRRKEMICTPLSLSLSH